jgi:hypothetical protein
VALLAPEALDLGHGDADDAELLERGLDRVEVMGADDAVVGRDLPAPVGGSRIRPLP